MNKSFLLPHWCQKSGWWILAALVVFCALMFIIASMDSENVIECPDWLEYPLLSIPFLPSLALFLICLSQEKQEDEYIAHIRARSIFITITFAFVISLINFPIRLIGGRMWSLEQMGTYLMYLQYLTNPIILTLLYLSIFKGSLFANWLKTRNYDGQ